MIATDPWRPAAVLLTLTSLLPTPSYAESAINTRTSILGEHAFDHVTTALTLARISFQRTGTQLYLELR